MTSEDARAMDMLKGTVADNTLNDCISRQAVLVSIKNLYPDMPVVDIMGSRRKWLDKYAPYFECENAIERLPSVNPQQKIGHWIKTGYIDKVTCSICNRKMWNYWEVNDFDYCPNCGAKMEGTE